MSPQGCQELWDHLLESNPDIEAVVMEVDDDHDIPSGYDEIDLNELEDA